jgi:predicted PurR-regulated permease PerM
VSDKQQKTITTCLIILATVAGVGALYLGRLFLVPIAVALVLNALFRPMVRGMQRRGIAPVFGGAIIVLGLIVLLVGLGLILSYPIRVHVQEGPQLFAEAQQKFERFRQPISKMKAGVKKLQDAVSVPDEEPAASRPTTAPAAAPSTPNGDGSKPPAEKEPVRTVQAPAVAPSGLASGFLNTATTILGGLAEVLLLLFLILAGGGKFFHKFVNSLNQSNARKIADEIVHEAEVVVLRYVGVTALINIGQATVVGLVLWWLDMPSPLLWAFFTFVLEFVPYLGAAVMVILLAVVALATRDSTTTIVMAPVSYLFITNLQNNLISPIAYGRRLNLNPAAVLIGVMFWWFVWDIPGAFIAVPILATIKIAADRIDGLKAFGEFLGE